MEWQGDGRNWKGRIMPEKIKAPGSEWELEQQPEESLLAATGRHIARGAARAAETIVGLPGDVLKLGNKIGLLPDLPPGAEFPGSEFIREKVTKPLTGQYLEPKTDSEAFADDVVSDFAALFLPGVKGAPLKSIGMRALKKAGISLGGNTLAYMAKDAGYGPLAQTGVKLGFFVGAGIPGTRNAIKKNQDVLYSTAESLIPEGESVSAPKFKETVGKISKKIQSGLGKEAPSKELLIKKVSKAEDIIHGVDKINVKDAWEAKKDLNELIFDDATPNKAKTHLIELRDELKDVIHDYGKNVNPEFYKYFEPAENIEYGLRAQSKVGRFIQNKLNFKFTQANSITKGAFLGGTFWKAGAPGIAKAAVTGSAIKGGYNLISLLGKSKFARTAYFNTIKAALAGNKITTLKNLKAFNSEANKYFPDAGEWELEG